MPLHVDPATERFVFDTSIRRIWMDIGTHARAQNTRPFLDRHDDLFVIGFEPMRYQWGEISTVNLQAPDKGWGYGHPRMAVLPAAATSGSAESWKTFHRNSQNMCSSLNELGKDKCGSVVEEYDIAAIRLVSVIDRIPPNLSVEFIKIDAQGHDLEVVKGIDKEVMKARVLHIILEVQSDEVYAEGSKQEDVISYMKDECGWRLVTDTANGSSRERNLAFDNAESVTEDASRKFWAEHRI